MNTTSYFDTKVKIREFCSAIFLDVSQAIDRVWLTTPRSEVARDAQLEQ